MTTAQIINHIPISATIVELGYFEFSKRNQHHRLLYCGFEQVITLLEYQQLLPYFQPHSTEYAFKILHTSCLKNLKRQLKIENIIE